jgi:hypothetical protein
MSTVTTVLALSRLFENASFGFKFGQQYMSKQDSYLGEKDFVIIFETPLERLLKSEGEHDQPRVIGVATTRKRCKTADESERTNTRQGSATYKGRSLTRNSQEASVP